ncbi:MAG: hypothetical protein B7Y39_17510 [Bdellovibrio sp. 28-41-41]|nr:MAG: hypothetical protein B7Y39_17510 [Bdellovibrio sp. 28-41-41]
MAKMKVSGDKKTVKTTAVRDHILTVPITKKNPTGKTVRDRHIRRLPGTDLNNDEIVDLFKKYDRKVLAYPNSKKLLEEYRNSDDYDELIAIWVDYFNKKLGTNTPLEPDSIKALIASESGFRHDPKENKIAFGMKKLSSIIRGF